MDRISELPEETIHRIYSFLPTKDVVKTSLLSNLWHSIFVSYPTLDFDRSLFTSRVSTGYDSDEKYITEHDDLEFIKYVNDSLLRLHKHNLHIKKFRLNMSCDRREPLPIPQSVEEVFGFCKNIRVLELCNCVLKRCLLEECVNLPCLNKLSLERVELDESTLKKLLESCPEVSDFSCDRCVGLMSLSVSGLGKLKSLNVVLMPRVGIGPDTCVAIDAPILENLQINASYCGDVKLVSGQNLKSVELDYGNVFNDEFLEDLVSKSPFLESLSLYYLCNLGRLNISSPHLKNLTIVSCQNLRDCEIDTPNLHTFRYIGYPLHVISFVSAVRCWWRIELDLLNKLYQLSDLKLFLQGKKIKYLTLSIRKGLMKSRKASGISPCCEVENLSLRVNNSGSGSYEKTIHGLVSLCQPENLNVECDVKSVEFLKGIFKNRMGLKNWNIERTKERVRDIREPPYHHSMLNF